jgi:post-segregation antitoxin (ccd killing protein)
MDTLKRNNRQYKWQTENRERINMLFPVGTREELKNAADDLGISMSEFVRQAIREKLDRMDVGNSPTV